MLCYAVQCDAMPCAAMRFCKSKQQPYACWRLRQSAERVNHSWPPTKLQLSQWKVSFRNWKNGKMKEKTANNNKHNKWRTNCLLRRNLDVCSSNCLLMRLSVTRLLCFLCMQMYLLLFLLFIHSSFFGLAFLEKQLFSACHQRKFVVKSSRARVCPQLLQLNNKLLFLCIFFFFAFVIGAVGFRIR